MTKIIDCIQMCEEKKLELKKEVSMLKFKYRIDELQFIMINASDDKGNERYLSHKESFCKEIGLTPILKKFNIDCTDDDILRVIRTCNLKRIPIILQLPIYDHLDKDLLLNAISKNVDADCFTTEWLGELFIGNDNNLAPATPKGVIRLIEYHDIQIEGKKVLVIGRSNHVGKALATMITNRGGTLIHTNTKTKDLKELSLQSDIIISCVGKLNLITPDMIKENVILIGVGFTYIDGKQILDFDIEKMVESNKPSIITNRINCTGKATVYSLIDNVIELHKINYQKKLLTKHKVIF